MISNDSGRFERFWNQRSASKGLGKKASLESWEKGLKSEKKKSEVSHDVAVISGAESLRNDTVWIKTLSWPSRLSQVVRIFNLKLPRIIVYIHTYMNKSYCFHVSAEGKL